MRWRLRLSKFTFDIVYKPGASHHLPDFMSRTRNNATVEHIDEDIQCLSNICADAPCLALAETANGLETGRCTDTDTPEPVAFDDIVEDQ